jgi:transcriptional regulator with XRE-family HTH domain
LADQTLSRHERLRSQWMQDPQFKANYERKRRSIALIQEMLQTIDAERKQAGLSKAKLAEQIGVDPATVRRLFTSTTSNPTLRTVLDLSGALGLSWKIQKPKRRARHLVHASRAVKPRGRIATAQPRRRVAAKPASAS